MSCDMLLWPSWPTTHLHHQQNHDKGSGDNHQGKKKKVSVLTFRTLWQKLEVCLCGHQYIVHIQDDLLLPNEMIML